MKTIVLLITVICITACSDAPIKYSEDTPAIKHTEQKPSTRYLATPSVPQTSEEMAYIGKLMHYWLNQESITDNQPRIFMAQRADISESSVILHGRLFPYDETCCDYTLGDPFGIYSPGYSHGFAPTWLADVPTVGPATLIE